MIHRCDAGPEIGTGHFFRQLALAEAAKARGRDPLILVSGLNGGLADQASAAGVEVEEVTEAVGGEADVRKVFARGRERGDVSVVGDGYRFGEDYYRRLGEAFRAVVAVDDLGEQPFPVDVLVNVNPHAGKLDYAEAARCLLGPRYALLRRQFTEARSRLEASGGAGPVPETVQRVLVAFGGGNPRRMTERALEALERSGYGGRADVVLGPAAGADAVESRSAGDAEVRVHRNVRDMVELMRGQHLALCAAGGMSWELACLGVPMMQTPVADNQEPIARALEERGVSIRVESSDRMRAGELARLFERVSGDRSLRATMSSRGMELVDGRGAERVLDCIERAGSDEDEP